MSHAEYSTYMEQHRLPYLVEGLLANVVPSAHPYPVEAVQQSLLVPCPSHEDVEALVTRAQQWERDHERSRSDWLVKLKSLTFDLFGFKSDSIELLAFLHYMFTDLGVLATFHIEEALFLRWLVVVRHNYHDSNPFHNFFHAFNVLQTLFAFLSCVDEFWVVRDDQTKSLLFSQVEVFAMLVSALCHDLQHPGVNNVFLIDTAHPLAVRYNDSAVLENHHAAVTFALLETAPLPTVRMTPQSLSTANNTNQAGAGFCDIANNLHGRFGSIAPPRRWKQYTALEANALPQQTFSVFRSLVIKCILGTEVAAHKRHIEELREQISKPLLSTSHNLCAVQQLLCHSYSAREALAVALVEAADVSNEIRSFDFSRNWAPRVIEEFSQQGDAMKALGWTKDIPPMFRRGTAHPASDQPPFIRFLCLPLYTELATVFPFFKECVTALENNAQRWGAQW